MGISLINFSSNTSNDTNTGSFYRYNPTEKEFNSIISYNGWMVASDSYNLLNRYITNKLKRIVHKIGLSNKVININKRNVNVHK